ncbi:unnamed protein product [Symbiodinium sp. KB8]|nr:unnamed protein product [Symbiodinium sp. KB8]
MIELSVADMTGENLEQRKKDNDTIKEEKELLEQASKSSTALLELFDATIAMKEVAGPVTETEGQPEKKLAKAKEMEDVIVESQDAKKRKKTGAEASTPQKRTKIEDVGKQKPKEPTGPPPGIRKIKKHPEEHRGGALAKPAKNKVFDMRKEVVKKSMFAMLRPPPAELYDFRCIDPVAVMMINGLSFTVVKRPRPSSLLVNYDIMIPAMYTAKLTIRAWILDVVGILQHLTASEPQSTWIPDNTVFEIDLCNANRWNDKGKGKGKDQDPADRERE